MTPFLRPLITSACALVFSITCAAAAGAPFDIAKEFRAEVQAEMMGQSMAFTLSADGEDRQRMDMPAMGMSTIIRKDQQKIFVLMTSQKQVMEMPYDPKMAQKGLNFSDDKNATWNDKGSDTVRDIACEKWEVTSGKGEHMTCWVKSDHTPVRITSKDGGTADFLSFTPGKQDAALFDPPTGWATMAGMGQMMPGK